MSDSTTSRLRAGARSVLAVLGVAAALTTSATALTTTSASADATTAVVRSAHFSPDTAGVDVYLAPFSGGGAVTLWVSDEKYGSISAYHRIAPGAYVVSMRPHGAPASTKPALSWTLNAKAGAAYTAAAVGRNAELRAVVLTDDLTAPAAGTGRVRVVQAASTAPSVSVEANGGVALAAKLPFGSTSDYTTVPTGRWDVRAVADSGASAAATSSLAVAPGSSSTLVVVDGGANTLAITSVQDSASAGTMPVGSVDAGGGGTATVFATASTGAPVVTLVVAGAAVLAVAGGAFAWTRRRRVGA